MKKITLLTLALTSFLLAEDGYVCENSTEYQEYIRGERETLNNATLYPTNEVCEDACVQYNACADVTIDTQDTELFSLAQFLTETDKEAVMSILSAGAISKITVSKDDDERTVVLNPSVDMSLWTPPMANPSQTNPQVSTTYAGGGVMLEWVKEMSVGVDYLEYKSDFITPLSLKENWETMSPGIRGNGIYYFEIDNRKIAIDKTSATDPYPSLPGTIYEDSYNYIKMREYDKLLTSSVEKIGISDENNSTCDGSPINDTRWNAEIIKDKPVFYTDENTGSNQCRWSEFDTETAYFIEYKVSGNVYESFKGNDSSFKIYGESYVTPYIYQANFTIDGVYMNMEIGEYLDATNMLTPHSVSATVSTSLSGSKCLMYGTDTNIGGDILPNLFSDRAACDSACKVNYNCVEWKESTCDLMGSEVSNPVTDYTGKTVYTKKTYDWHCTKEFTEQIDCGEWEITTIHGSLDYGSFNPGFETMDFGDSFGQAIGAAQTMEQMQHIWSGWEGFCESGVLMDNSWMSDPMQILSLAMMAYTGALDGGYGTAVQESTKAASESVVQAAGEATSSWAETTGLVTDGMLESIGNSLGSTYQAIENAGTVSRLSATIDAVNAFATTGEFSMRLLSLAGEIATIAIAGLSDMSEEDVQVADNYMKTLMGQDVSDLNALTYANCMASLGLSFVNIVAYSADDLNSTSPELKNPYDHPVRVTEDQFATLQLLAGEDVEGYYYISEYEAGLLTIHPLTASALSNIGGAICTDNMKEAMIVDYLTESTTQDSGSKTGAVVNASVSMALGYLPAPYNLAASIIFKAFTSISNGDACTDSDLATKWGLIQAQTNKALIGSQCHLTKGECIAEYFWGSCMRDRYTYCCYDQETTRIFVEGVKEELNRGWDSCNDITIFDLQDVSFRPCLAGEIPSVNKCFPTAKYNELTSALTKNAAKGLDIDRLKDQATESLTLPGQSTPWDE